MTYVLPNIGGDIGVWGSELNTIITDLDSRITTLATTGSSTQSANDTRYGKILNTHLVDWVLAESWTWSTATYDSANRMTAASIVWPDGSTGTYAATVLNNTLNTVDAFTATYVNSTASKTCTQPTVTRDGSGNITVRPAVTVA